MKVVVNRDAITTAQCNNSASQLTRIGQWGVARRESASARLRRRAYGYRCSYLSAREGGSINHNTHAGYAALQLRNRFERKVAAKLRAVADRVVRTSAERWTPWSFDGRKLFRWFGV